ncbi:MAG: hypothetical protein ACJAUP_002426 [Cellvibrionaceae bacterium]|jgi:hypothetical protein
MYKPPSSKNTLSKKIGFALLLGTCASVSASEFYNAKTLATGGAGVAGADFNNGALLNPALVAQQAKDAKGNVNNNALSMNASVGILGSDKDELIESLEDLDDELDDIDDSIPSSNEVEDIVDLLNDIDRAEANFEFASYFQIVLPNKHLSLAFYVNLMSDTSVSANVVTSDITALNAAADTAVFDSDAVASEVLVLGTGIGEYGIALGKTVSLSDSSSLTFGFSPKFQDIDIYDYVATVDNYDEDDFDDRSSRSSESHFNADVGLHYTINDAFSLAAVIKNINEDEFETEENRLLELESRSTAGFIYRTGENFFEINLDLDASKEFASQQETQMLRLGSQLDLVSWAKFRFGLRHDLEDNTEDLFTFGLGFKSGRVMSIDFAGILGEGETLGGVIQFGFKL